MNNDYLWDRTGKPDAEVQELEDVLGTLRYQPQPFELPADLQPAPRRRFFPTLAIAATIALLVLAAGIWLRLSRQQAQQTLGPREIAKTGKDPESAKPLVVTPLPPSETAKVNTVDADQREPARQRNPTARRTIAARNSDRNDSALLRDEMTAAQRAEGEAAKEQLLLALRVVSAKLNLAQRKLPATNNIRNQHKLG
jgi:hypothetical protein